ncbi:MAG TPA: serine hydrolase [Candidatus Limnocylindria bacterium]|nr:serine hydrolase [Candidatus Limnocylindria bacterium]
MTAHLLTAALVAGSLLAGSPARASTSELIRHLDELAGGFPGGVGIYIADPRTPQPLYARNADEHVITASLYKLGVLAEAERRVDAGDLKYSDLISIEPEDITEDGSFEPVGTALTVDEALEKMITISDNGSALALWRVLGPANIDATLVKIGLRDFHVALDHDEDNVATPRAVGSYFAMLANRQLISAAASDRMLARLARQEINDRLPAALPDGVVVAHKTGNLPGITHDAGIIFTPSGPRVVVAMTWDTYEEDAATFISNIGAAVYSAVLEPPANARYAVPRTVVADIASRARVTVTVTNAGPNSWAASGAGAVGLIWELRDADDTMLLSSPAATRLPALAPSRSANIGLQIPTPADPGIFKVTIGLVDANGRALSGLGAATADFEIKTHKPFLVKATIAVPMVLHRGEPSLVTTKFTALATAGTSGHDLVLTWRVLDTRNGRTVEDGIEPVGRLQPGSEGTFFSSLAAPKILGTYRLAYELREGDDAVSETTTRTVTIVGPRTYPDDEGGRTSGPFDGTPATTPRARPPFPTPSGAIVPRLDLPPFPSPKGKASPPPTPR